jgi:hypothetical protein
VGEGIFAGAFFDFTLLAALLSVCCRHRFPAREGRPFQRCAISWVAR